MDDFIELRLLDCVSHGTSFALEFSTNIITLRSGIENRNANWDYPKAKFSVDYNCLTVEDTKKLRETFIICKGSATAFRFKDWTDFQVEKQFLTTATGSKQEVQLFKSYKIANKEFKRKITKPIKSTIELFSGGKMLDFEVNSTGIISFTAPKSNEVSISFEYDVPVRFLNDNLTLTPIVRKEELDGFLTQTSIELQEVIL